MTDPRTTAEQFAQLAPPRNVSALGFAPRSGQRMWLLLATGLIFTAAGILLLGYAVMTTINFFTSTQVGVVEFPFAPFVAGLLTGSVGLLALSVYARSGRYARTTVSEGTMVPYQVIRHEQRSVGWSPVEQPFVVLQDADGNELGVRVTKELRNHYYPVGTSVPVAVHGELRAPLIP